MKINVHIKQEIPNGFFCYTSNGRKCIRLENEDQYCSLFNKFIWQYGGRFVKCKECLNAAYETLTRQSGDGS